MRPMFIDTSCKCVGYPHDRTFVLRGVYPHLIIHQFGKPQEMYGLFGMEYSTWSFLVAVGSKFCFWVSHVTIKGVENHWEPCVMNHDWIGWSQGHADVFPRRAMWGLYNYTTNFMHILFGYLGNVWLASGFLMETTGCLPKSSLPKMPRQTSRAWQSRVFENYYITAFDIVRPF